MSLIKAIVTTLLVSVLVAGCANVGNIKLKGITEAEIQKIITVGKTTQNDVKAQFGSPFQTSFTDGGLAIWTYQYDDTSTLTPETVGSVVFTLGIAGTKAKGTRHELVLLFDENKVVKNFNMSNNPIEIGTGVF